MSEPAQDLPSRKVTETKQVMNRSMSDALKIANDYYTSSKSRSPLPASEKDVTVIYSSTTARNSNSDTLMYAIDSPNGDGFVIISAPVNVTPIIGIAEDGSFNDDTTNSNDAFQYALALSRDYVTSSTLLNPDKITVSNKTDTLKSYVHVSRRISVDWDQRWPGNIYCSNGLTGCVPLSIAMICSYFGEPSSASLEYSERDQESVSLNWDEIKKHTGRNYFSTIDPSTDPNHFDNCTTEEHHRNLARFIRQIGHKANASYNENATSVKDPYPFSTLKYYLPNQNRISGSNSSELINDIIDYNGVALMLGNSGIYGHAWVADGAMHMRYIITNYEYMPFGEDPITTTTEENKYYLHLNWGWGGKCNGFFLADVFNTLSAYQYDSPLVDNSAADLDFSNTTYYLYLY
jgi:hypothetical protein